jgi:hypothetical protein
MCSLGHGGCAGGHPLARRSTLTEPVTKAGQGTGQQAQDLHLEGVAPIHRPELRFDGSQDVCEAWLRAETCFAG